MVRKLSYLKELITVFVGKLKLYSRFLFILFKIGFVVKGTSEIPLICAIIRRKIRSIGYV